MDLEDQHRFQVEGVAVYDDPTTLAELNQRADEHTEVCR